MTPVFEPTEQVRRASPETAGAILICLLVYRIAYAGLPWRSLRGRHTCIATMAEGNPKGGKVGVGYSRHRGERTFMAMPPSTQERFVLGQQRRKQIRRTEHGVWKAKERREDPLKLMRKSMHGRVPALVALKYERMEASPFGFFRGAVPVMAYDFSLAINTGILSQLCGDAHVRNLGAYAGPDGRLVFDINDFDETIAGPFEWDVKRMATSLILAGREAGATHVHCREAAVVFLERYRRSMAAFARMPVLE